MSCRSSDHLPQHSCSQTLLEQSWTTSCTNSCSSHTCTPRYSQVACFTAWMNLKVFNLAWKFFKGLTFASQREALLPTKTCLQIRYCYRVCFCTAFHPPPSLKSHWPWYLQKEPHHHFLSTHDGSNPLISVLVCSRATQLGNDTPTY